mgnify:CR=1 FL=1
MKQNRSFQDGLRKWINGNIRAKEEAQLDQISQEDDFARDALDGLRSFSDIDHQQNIDRLRKQLQQKNKPAVIIPIMVRRIAAAILFLVVVGMTWWLNQPNATGTLSMDQTTESPTETTATPNEKTTPITEPTTQVLDTEDEVLPSPPPKPETNAREQAPQTVPNQSAPINTRPASPEVALIEEVDEEVLADKMPAPPPSQEEMIAIRSKSQAAEKGKEPVTTSLPQAYEDLPIQMISGRILDPTGQPVAGALIRDLENQQETRSDFAGNFSIQQALSGQAAGVQISHFNYADTTLQVKMDQTLSINLKKRNSALSEVNNTQQPFPVGGFSYFQDQSATNAKKRAGKVSRSAVSAAPSGTTIRFTVYADGTIGNLQVVSSPDRKTERKALKQLRLGPKWVLPAGLDSLDTQITIPMSR